MRIRKSRDAPSKHSTPPLKNQHQKLNLTQQPPQPPLPPTPLKSRKQRPKRMQHPRINVPPRPHAVVLEHLLHDQVRGPAGDPARSICKYVFGEALVGGECEWAVGIDVMVLWADLVGSD
ncbi:hypothetical protein CCMA1212_002607 [Trichoderma ghanense]|uniref:Uncharacterized protein n=1 Tax=Trichoderma ghanense TaxID=65468 RepID=A0ABY2HAU5_9HYPO